MPDEASGPPSPDAPGPNRTLEVADGGDATDEVRLVTDTDPASLVGGEGRSDVLAAAAPPVAGQKPKRKWGIGFWLAVVWLATVVVAAVLADVLPFVRHYEERFGASARQGPSLEFWFGVDSSGFDVFSRVVYGARVSLIVAVASIGIGFALGGLFGLLAGYFRGRLETVIVAAADIMLAFPPLILALALVAFLSAGSDTGGQGASLGTVILALAILAIPSLTRITRAATLTFSQREFVLAARALGGRHRRILVREVLPNVVPPMASFALLAIAIVIVAEGALSFLGLSVRAPTPTWGRLIAEGKDYLELAPHTTVMPSLVMFLTILSLNFVGDVLRGRFDVREGAL